jgi:hypothetical protein
MAHTRESKEKYSGEAYRRNVKGKLTDIYLQVFYKVIGRCSRTVVFAAVQKRQIFITHMFSTT